MIFYNERKGLFHEFWNRIIKIQLKIILKRKFFFYKSNLSIEVQITGFQRWKIQKSRKSKKKIPPKSYLSSLFLELLILFVFIQLVWFISANWCLKKSCSQTQLVVHKFTLIYKDQNASSIFSSYNKPTGIYLQQWLWTIVMKLW